MEEHPAVVCKVTGLISAWMKPGQPERKPEGRRFKSGRGDLFFIALLGLFVWKKKNGKSGKKKNGKSGKKKNGKKNGEKNLRLAVIDRELCKPKYCNKECIRFCPLVRSNVNAIFYSEENDIPIISEKLCTGCGICIKKCPFKAISIVNLPEELDKRSIHRYGINGFKLFGLPIPRIGQVVGIIGRNGTGKTTILKILAGKIVPNLGDINKKNVNWSKVIRFFRGTTLQLYFEKMIENKIKVVYKPQEVDKIPLIISDKVSDIIERVGEREKIIKIKKALELENIWNRSTKALSGGELQKLAIAVAMVKPADVYLFDEPSSYLDVRGRLIIAKAIRKLVNNDLFIIVVEHDLAVLDYISDLIHIIFGEPGVYGIVSLPRVVREGINVYLNGYLRKENIRIRKERIVFKPPSHLYNKKKEDILLSWSNIEKKIGHFELRVDPGSVYRGAVVGILGPNSIGKTTFIKMLAGLISPDNGYIISSKSLTLSYKPQLITKFRKNILLKDFLIQSTGKKYLTNKDYSMIINPLGLNKLLDKNMINFSGGELQVSIIASCLLKDADIYLLDEPMAFLDVEQRLTVARILKRKIEQDKKTAFVVEHDIIAQDFLSSSLMVFLGEPGKSGHGFPPMKMRDGMNIFLKEINITFRRDKDTGRPRINRENSWLDRYQKNVLHEYYYMN